MYTTPVQGQCDDEEYDRQGFLNVLLYMYSKNKLVDILCSQKWVLLDITDISNNGKENRKPRRSSKFRRILHSVCRRMKHLFCCFSSPTISQRDWKIVLSLCIHPSVRCMLLVKFWKMTSNNWCQASNNYIIYIFVVNCCIMTSRYTNIFVINIFSPFCWKSAKFYLLSFLYFFVWKPRWSNCLILITFFRPIHIACQI